MNHMQASVPAKLRSPSVDIPLRGHLSRSQFIKIMKTPPNQYCLVDTQGRRHILSDQLEATSLLLDFMRLVLKTKATYFKTTIGINGRRYVSVSPLAGHMPRLRSYARLYDPTYSYSPALSFFFEQYRQHQIKEYAGSRPEELTQDGGTVSALFDDFVRVLRERAKAVKVVKSVADWKSKSAKNMKRALAVESELFSRHGRIGVIRLDLEYRAATFSAEEIEQHMAAVTQKKRLLQDEVFWGDADFVTAAPMEGRVSFEEVQHDRKRLFANMKGKPSLFEYLLGYVSRIECSPLAGYHLHLVLFFNGAKVVQLEWLAQQIGEYWVKQITEGRGRFHNCNLAWNENHPDYGVGMISHDDHAKRANLRGKVLPYLCKRDQSVEVLPYKGCNVFAAEVLHRGKSKGRGRKRTRGLKASQPTVLLTRSDIQNRPS